MRPRPGTVRSPSLLAQAILVGLAGSVTACGPSVDSPGDDEAGATSTSTPTRSVALNLWNEGQPAFGVFVPDERPREERVDRSAPRPPPIYTLEGVRQLAANPLYDFLFLNLEGAYDLEAVRTLVAGLEVDGEAPKTLLVRIPPISRDGAAAAGQRVRDVLALGADGVVLPHVRTVEEAQTAIGFFEAAGANVWSPQNPDGTVAAMLMLEDPDAVAAAGEIADLGGYSVLACGIGSLTGALGGDREAAEAGNQAVLAEATRAGLADMITANDETIESRIAEGFLGLLMQGPTADDVIRKGRAAAGRGL